MKNKIVQALLNIDENLLALSLVLILIALTILSGNTTPTWIYQGF